MRVEPLRAGRIARILTLLVLFACSVACRAPKHPVDAEGRPLLRLGYMPNLTHAPALLGLQSGLFQKRLGEEGVVLEPKAFVAGPSIIEALFAGEIDVAYVGPNPAINGFAVSEGTALRVVCGSTTGGASFVVRPRIRNPADLAGMRVAAPAIANTQDIALRTWLDDVGLGVKGEGGEVEVLPIAPSDIMNLFQRDQLVGAWLPEPWASRLVLQADGHVLVDERDLWEDGRFSTTVLVASGLALENRLELVDRFLAAHSEAVRRLVDEPEAALRQIDAFLQEAGLPIRREVLTRAFAHMGFSTDPLPSALETLAERAARLGYLRKGVDTAAMMQLRCGQEVQDR